MTVTVSAERLEDSRVSLQVSVSREAVDQALDRAFRRLVKKVNVPGFRRGKAPRTVFQRFYGEGALLEEALKELLPEEYGKACEEANIEPVDEPQFQEPNVDEKGLSFKALVYVKPKVKLEKYEEMKIPFESPKEVSDEDIQKQVEQLRERMAELVPLSDNTPLENGNYATIEVKGVDGGDIKSKLNQELSYYPVGSPNPLFPGLGEALFGMKKGETKEFDSTFKVGLTETKTEGEAKTESQPTAKSEQENVDEPKKEAPGKTEVTMRFQVHVKECYQKQLPQDDQELAKKLGKDSMEAVKTEIKKALTELRSNAAREKYLDKVEEELVGMAEIETIPRAMIRRRTQELLERLERRLNESKTTVEDYLKASNKTWDQLLDEMEKEAEKDVRRDLVLDFVVQKDKVEAPEERINGIIKSIAGEMGQDEKAVRTTLEVKGSLGDIEEQMKRVEALEKVAKRAAENAGTKFPDWVSEDRNEEEKSEEEQEGETKGEEKVEEHKTVDQKVETQKSEGQKVEEQPE